jgi:hypothetical protein
MICGRSAWCRLVEFWGGSSVRAARAAYPCAVLGAALCVLGIAVAPALAAGPPETPELSVESPVPATTATLHGVLQPLAVALGEAGTYEFLYKASKTGVCQGGSHAPASPGLSLGAEHEEVTEELTGLLAHTEYAVCLRAENTASEATLSAPVTFKTALPPEAPKTEAAKAITAASATLHAQLNPLKAGEAGTYEFEYLQSPTECTGGAAAPEPAGVMTGVAKQAVAVPVSGLEPNAEYTFCAIAVNNAGEAASGSALTFKTLALPPTVVGVSAPTPRATEVRLEAVVNANNEPTEECKFEFGETTSYGSELPCEPAGLEGFGPQGVGATVAGLTQNTAYDYRVVVKNATGTREGAGEFTTALPPEVPSGEQANPITASAATLEGVLNPGAEGDPGSYEFFYRNSPSECQGESQTPAELATGEEAEPAESIIEGLLPNTTYTFCLRASNEAGEEALGRPVTFTTLSATPTLTNESTERAGASEATLSAEVDPGGAPTSYEVEYEPSKTTAPQYLAASTTAVDVQVTLTGLTPGTDYHYRFLAHNERGLGEGEEKTFRTAPPSGSPSSLPDDRVYELVSGESYPGEVYVPKSGEEAPSGGLTAALQPFRAAASGEALAYVGGPTSVGGNGNNGPGEGDEFVAKRGPAGWDAENITPEMTDTKGESVLASYEWLASDVSTGVFGTEHGAQFAGGVSVPEAVPAGCDVLYSYIEGGFHPLFGETLTPGVCGHDWAEEFAYRSQGLLAAGANEGGNGVAKDSELLFQSPAPLTAGTAQAEEGGNNLYIAAGGRLSVVSVLPGGGGEDANAEFGSGATQSLSNVISADGRRVFWTDVVSGRVFMRENPLQPQSALAGESCTEPAKACTVAVSAGAAQYSGATPEGRYAYYVENGELWRYDTLGGMSTAVAGTGAGVLGVIGINETGEEGAFTYFVAEGVLASNKREYQNAAGDAVVEEAAVGQPNLYVREGEVTRFIVTLSFADDNLAGGGGEPFGVGDWYADQGFRTAEVTPDGQYVVFESELPLTGYDTAPLAGQRAAEVFVAGAAGTVSCASCAPSGAPPVAENVHDTGTYLPVSMTPTFMLRWASKDGEQVFFDTSQPLVGQDENGVQDVYEWEREGDGSCPAQSPPRLDGGCEFLLSGTNSSTPSYFLDADTSGENVFFTHRGELGGAGAADGKNDVFDARVGGGFPHIALGCTGSGCQSAPPAAPTFTAPASVTFSGAGNFAPAETGTPKKTPAQIRAEHLARALKACRAKHSRRKRVACEALARKRYGPPAKSKKRASAEKASGNHGGKR